MPPPRITAIGGGHGLARTLAASRILGADPTAVVSVADDGGSSGRLRRDMDVVPPGDLRMALSTLCPDPVRRALLEHRFTTGELAGHALGNLVLLAGADLRDGDLGAGLALLAELFGVRGRVLPVGDHPVSLRGHLDDGTTVHGQRVMTSTPGLQRVEVVGDDTRASAAAIAAVDTADMVVVGPGSWFTSLVPPLLADGLAAALAATSATTVLVGNIRQQPGETADMDMRDHLQALFSHLPDNLSFDVLVANDAPVPAAAATGVQALSPPAGHPRIGDVLTAGLVDDRGNHDRGALAAVLQAVLDGGMRGDA